MAKRKTKTYFKKLRTETPKKKGARREAYSVAYSTHKARTRWFNAREAWPLREAPQKLLLQARSDAVANINPVGVSQTWQQAGPTNIGGRMTSIVVDPNDVNRVWAGAAGGGVWQSNDGGSSWGTNWHDEPSLNIGSLCIDPNNPDWLYCGTGEANLSADSYAGVGLYRSVDGGASWQLLYPATSSNIPTRIGRIAVDPFDSTHIFLAGVGHSNNEVRGLFESRDSGISWSLITQIFSAPYMCHDVVFHPFTQGTVYTTIDARGFHSGVWRSTNGGRSWSQLTSGFLAGPNFGRTSLAIAYSDPQVLYALVAERSGPVLGVYRSRNDGNTWTEVGGTHFQYERQMSYNNTIAVDPNNSDIVICGGVDLHRTKNGGTTWTKITDWSAQRGVDSDYCHADQHGLAMLGNGLVYAANDGGVDVSTDGGNTWQNRSDGLATNMFYDLSVAATNKDMFGGGLQDNGTVLTLDGHDDSFIELTGGDGGFCVIDPNDELHLFTSSQFMRINRFRQSDGWSADIGPPEADNDRPWMAFLAMDPDRPKRIFAGSRRVLRSTNDGSPSSWRDVSGILDNSFITCIEVSRHDTDVIYVGTENGGIFKSINGGDDWSHDIASSMLPGRTITRLRTPADDTEVIYATVANFGNSHLFRSTDGGVIWIDVDEGNLPDAPFHGIVVPSYNSEHIYLGGDAGVFVSSNAGGTWQNLSMNLPSTMVVDLVLHESSKTLLAATYGRSTWRIDVSNL